MIEYKMSLWNEHVASMWNKNKHLAGYSFKKALKDAKKTYKGGKSKKSNSKSRKNKTRKNRH
jgi:hypothetical protein